MTTLTEHIDVDAITEQAKQVHFWRSIVTVIAAILFGLGWVSFRFFAVIWFALAWGGCAVREGWREARPKRGPSPVR